MEDNSNKEPIRPMLMQYAEPEYMCECGYKFYCYGERPDSCPYCNQEFDWVNGRKIC